MQSTAAGPAQIFMNAAVTGTQPTRCYRLLVHADRLPSGEPDGLRSVLYARTVADNDPTTLTLYADGSGNYQGQQAPTTGVAAAWRRRTEPLFHATGRQFVGRRMLSDEFELWAVYEALSTACAERWVGVESRVLVLTDNDRTLRAVRDW